MHGSIQDIFIKKIFLNNIKKNFKNAWIDLGHFYKKIFFATMKKFPVNYKNFFGTINIFFATIKRVSSQLSKKFFTTIKKISQL